MLTQVQFSKKLWKFQPEVPARTICTHPKSKSIFIQILSPGASGNPRTRINLSNQWVSHPCDNLSQELLHVTIETRNFSKILCGLEFWFIIPEIPRTPSQMQLIIHRQYCSTRSSTHKHQQQTIPSVLSPQLHDTTFMALARITIKT